MANKQVPLVGKGYPVAKKRLASRLRRVYVSGIASALLFGAVIAGPVQAQAPSSALATVAVERRALADMVLLDGVIEAVQQSTVSAQTSGKVLQLPFDVDDSVRPGDMIAQLEDSEQRARVSQAQAAVNEARAAKSDAKQRFARIESVHKRGLVSGQEFDQARNNLAGAQARAERADAVWLKPANSSITPVLKRLTAVF